MNNLMMNGTPVVIVPNSKSQNRTHNKKRINKKWAKRYGFTTYEILDNGKVLIFGGVMYMNQKTYEALRKML